MKFTRYLGRFVKQTRKSLSRGITTYPARTLISTKLDMPPLKEKMVHRGRLLERLSQSKTARLILISAMAGSGKTSLACQWIKQDKLTAAWFGLDNDDNDPDLFLRYMLTTLCKADKTLEPAIQPFLQGQKSFADKEIMPHLIEHLKNSTEDIYLVLDDYHLVVNPVIHETVSHLLSHLPPRLHLMVLSRYSLPFSVSSLRVRDQLLEISSEEIKFTKEETRQFFSEIMSGKLSVHETDNVFQQTEGWVGGLQLFGLSWNKNRAYSSPITGVDGVNDMTTEYLIDEVLSVQSEKIRKFLSTTCFLDRFTVEVCKEVTGFADAAEIIDYLYRNNLFVVPLDSEGKWYRYHNLLSETVKKRHMMESPEEINIVHRKAARWFGQNGCMEDAFRHAFATKDLEFAADTIEDHLSVIINSYDFSFGLRWINRLPVEVRMEHALLSLAECHIYGESVEVSKSEAIIHDVERRKDVLFNRYSGNKRSLCEGMYLFLKALLSFSRNPSKVNIKQLEVDYDQLLPREPFTAAAIKTIMAGSFLYQGKPKTAIDTLNKVSEDVPVLHEKPALATWWSRSMALAEMHRGRLGHAEALLVEAEELLERKGLSYTPLLTLLRLPRAWIYFRRNNLAKASDLVTGVLTHVNVAYNRNIIIDGNVLTMAIFLENGRIDEMVRQARKMQFAIPENSEWTQYVDPLLVLADMLIGNTGNVEQWVDQKGLPTKEPFSLFIAHERLTCAVLLGFLGRHEESITVLDDLREKCAPEDMGDVMLMVDINSAVAYTAMGNREKATAALKRALVFAEREGYVQPFVRHAQSLAPILKTLAENPSNDTSSDHLTIIMKACGISVNDGGLPDIENHGLTAREREMLSLMAQGLKNKEIAEKTFISLPTVKSHVQHIYEKLNVTTRVQAIKRAEALAILSNRQ